MNQILDTKQPNNNNNNNNGKHNSNSKLKKFKGILRFQLYFSIVLIIIIGLYVFYNTYKLSKQEKYSKQILENYNLTRLYSNVVSNNSYSDDNQSTDSLVDSSYVIGVIDIPKINVNYPIFSNYDEEHLKLAIHWLKNQPRQIFINTTDKKEKEFLEHLRRKIEEI